jgi:hypothetical protein
VNGFDGLGISLGSMMNFACTPMLEYWNLSGNNRTCGYQNFTTLAGDVAVFNGTNVPLREGWHLFEFNVSNNQYYMWIDHVLVGRGTSSTVNSQEPEFLSFSLDPRSNVYLDNLNVTTVTYECIPSQNISWKIRPENKTSNLTNDPIVSYVVQAESNNPSCTLQNYTSNNSLFTPISAAGIVNIQGPKIDESDPSPSLAGTYHVTYTAADNCSNTITTQNIVFIAGNGTQSMSADTSGFNGNTTDMSVDASNLTEPILEVLGSFRIQWDGSGLNFTSANFTQNVLYDNGTVHWVSVNSSNLPSDVNTSANLTFYNVPGYVLPYLNADGALCGDCSLISYDGTNVVFQVQHFTNYSLVNGSLPTYNVTIHMINQSNVQVQSFCTAVNGTDNQCTTNGSSTYTVNNGSYLIVGTPNGSYYNASAVVNVTNANVEYNLSTKEFVQVSNVQVKNASNSAGPFWNATMANVTVSWSHNGLNTVVAVIHNGTTIATVYNATSASVLTNSMDVGLNTIDVQVNETFGAQQSSAQNSSSAFNVSKLSQVSNVAVPALVLQNLFNVTWSAATGGLGVTKYDVVTQVGAVNVTGLNDTTNVYAQQNVSTEGSLLSYVRSQDDWFTTGYVQSNAGVVDLSVDLSGSCSPLTYPNELNLPVIANISVQANASYANFTSPVFNVSVKLGSNVVYGTCTVGTVNSTVRQANCTVPMQFYFAPGSYDLNVTVSDGVLYTSSVTSGLCEYGELVATTRSVEYIVFPNAVPGVNNSPGSPPVVLRNTGNALLNVSLTGYDLTGRTSQASNLSASRFKAGLALGNATVLSHGVASDLNVSIGRGVVSNASILFWLSMPSNQVAQEYYSATPWSLEASG